LCEEVPVWEWIDSWFVARPKNRVMDREDSKGANHDDDRGRDLRRCGEEEAGV
jgi:hypothetical protein